MLSGESKLIHQDSEMPPGLDELVINGGVLRLAGSQPGTICSLLLEDSLRFRQLPQATYGANLLPQEIAPYKVLQRLVSGR
jgi:hypothetical protein